MRRKIDGKVYDTGTAKFIVRQDNRLPRGDLFFTEETLYRTSKGDFFLAGEGGACSRYAKPREGTWTGYGTGLVPLTMDEALEWMKSVRVAEKIVEEYFPSSLVG